jgi:hypothetical protein
MVQPNVCRFAFERIRRKIRPKRQNLLPKLTLFSQSQKKTPASAGTINWLCELRRHPLEANVLLGGRHALFWLRPVAASASLKSESYFYKKYSCPKEPKQTPKSFKK